MWMRYYSYGIALFIFIVDFITKKWIENNLELYEKINVIGTFFQITSIRNTGAAFSILENQRLFFLIVTVIVVGGLIWYIQFNRKTGRPLMMIALGLVLGGACGNFIDRLVKGEVVDFFQFNFGSYTFPIFNVADIGIVCGVILILLDSFLTREPQDGVVSADSAAAGASASDVTETADASGAAYGKSADGGQASEQQNR